MNWKCMAWIGLCRAPISVSINRTMNDRFRYIKRKKKNAGLIVLRDSLYGVTVPYHPHEKNVCFCLCFFHVIPWWNISWWECVTWPPSNGKGSSNDISHTTTITLTTTKPTRAASRIVLSGCSKSGTETEWNSYPSLVSEKCHTTYKEWWTATVQWSALSRLWICQ